MLKKINDFLSGVAATIIAGVFLLIDLIPHILSEFNINYNFRILPFDSAWITVIISGIPMLYLAIWRIIHNPGISKISSALLISIAMIAAILIGDVFAAGEVAWIMAIGAILEDKTTKRAKKGLKNLISLTPQKARLIKNDNEEIIDAFKICVGDIIRVLPGETIPVDGVIINGETSIDQSIMTGESLPVDKKISDTVFCGTINRFGSVDIKATKVGEDSSLQKLINLIKEAENKKAPMARIADIAASWFVPVALLIAIITGIITKNIERAVTVLVVFCPCALVLATPTAIMAAIGQATKHGVIIKSGEALENMGKVDTIAFDKTGTLTYGKLEVSDVISFDENFDNYDLVSFAASVEQKSEHPLAKAIVSYAKNCNIKIVKSDNFKMSVGSGVFATVNNHNVMCGNENYLIENSITINEEIKNSIEELRMQGKATIIVSIDENIIGIIAMSDTVKPEAENVINKLHQMNTNIILLTGDNYQTANFFANKVNIKNVKAQLLPVDKVNYITEIQNQGKKVCMIGDGVNDAPALKTANVSVAMGGLGSDVSIDASDIVLMSDDISKLPYLKKLSNATVKTIKFSISLSMIINIIAVTLSVLGILTPTTGALVHNAGSCFVVLIAALLYDRKFE